MASKHSSTNRTLRGKESRMGRIGTSQRRVARALKYDVPEPDFATLERELSSTRRTYGGQR